MTTKKAVATKIDYNVVPGDDSNTITVNGVEYVRKSTIFIGNVETGDMFYFSGNTGTSFYKGDIILVGEDTDNATVIANLEQGDIARRTGQSGYFDEDDLKRDFNDGDLEKITHLRLAELLTNKLTTV